MGDTISVLDEDGVVYSIPLNSTLMTDEIHMHETAQLLQSSASFANGNFYISSFSKLLVVPAIEMKRDD